MDSGQRDAARCAGYEVGAADYVYVPVVPDILRGKVQVLVQLYLQKVQLSGLNERAYAMESIITFIDDTARRLQLLALNGNIIAAQAGEQGRAFRVVCRELGSLADAAKLTASDVRRLAGTMGLDRLDAGEIMSTEGHGFGHTSASTSTESAIVDESSRTSGDER